MNIFNRFKTDLLEILHEMAAQNILQFDPQQSQSALADKITAEPPRQAEHGDIATNAAMVLAKANKIAPPALAEKIAERLNTHLDIETATAAGGFVNVRMQARLRYEILEEIIAQEKNFGRNNIGKGEKINVEYVSVNPTGPLHIGHARGAVVGDVLVRLLGFCGYRVTREYYVNDGGAQVDWLARSAHWRYLQAARSKSKTKTKLEQEYENCKELYPGDYLIPIGEELYRKYGDKFTETPENEWLDIFRTYSVAAMMDIIRKDLESLKIKHDIFVSERQLIDDKMPEKTLQILQEKNHLYEGVPEAPKGKKSADWQPRPQTLFRATDFGDDQDRALKKSDGSWTYFTADIANHLHKYQRGYKRMIDIFGADHAGYVSRMQAAVKAVSGGEAELKILTCQLVRFMDKGEPVRMSKRAGQFVTLGDLVREVGADAVRIYMLTRKADAQLDFDFGKTVESHRDNPVFYIQYAHARSYSVERMFQETFGKDADWRDADPALLTSEGENLLLRKLTEWPRFVELAAIHSEPHRISFYAYELASLFHSLWNQGNVDENLRFVGDDFALTKARMKLIMGMRYVLQAIADIIGFEARHEL